MNGVTGRMGMNQHLIRSIVAIRNDGGVVLKNGKRVMPDPILVARNLHTVAAPASKYGIERYTDDPDADRKSVVSGKSVSVSVAIGGRRIHTKQNQHTTHNTSPIQLYQQPHHTTNAH